MDVRHPVYKLAPIYVQEQESIQRNAIKSDVVIELLLVLRLKVPLFKS